MTVAYLFGGGVGPAAAFSGTITLPANGGSVAIPFTFGGVFIPQTVTCRTTDTSGSHTLEVALYSDGGDGNDVSLTKLVSGSFTFTAAAAAVRTGVFAGGRVQLSAGSYWLVCRNAGSTTTTLSTTAAGGLGGNCAGTQTLASLAGDLPSSGWSATASLPLVRIDGSIYAIGGGTLN